MLYGKDEYGVEKEYLVVLSETYLSIKAKKEKN